MIDSLAVYKDAAGEMEVMHLSTLSKKEAIELGMPISTRSSGLMKPSARRKPPARAIASRSGTAQTVSRSRRFSSSSMISPRKSGWLNPSTSS